MKHLIRAFMIGILKTAEPTPVKRDYRKLAQYLQQRNVVAFFASTKADDRLPHRYH
jgi:hypothetical protein